MRPTCGQYKEQCKKVLFDTIEVFKEVDITTFLVGGTLLGAIRDKDFIKDDLDIDIGIRHNQFPNEEQIQKLVIALSKRNIKLEGVWGEHLLRVKASYCPLHVDIYVYWLENNEWHNNVPIPIPNPRRIRQRFYKKSVFNTIIKTEFLGKEIFIPQDAEEYLKALYGTDKWRIPNSEGLTWRNYSNARNLSLPKPFNIRTNF